MAVCRKHQQHTAGQFLLSMFTHASGCFRSSPSPHLPYARMLYSHMQHLWLGRHGNQAQRTLGAAQ